MASGKDAQAVTTRTKFGSARADKSIFGKVGTVVGTARYGLLRNSLLPYRLTESETRSSEPRVRGSSPFGCTNAKGCIIQPLAFFVALIIPTPWQAAKEIRPLIGPKGAFLHVHQNSLARLQKERK